MMPRKLLFVSLILVWALSACDAFKEDEVVVPTIADVEDAATAIVLTENAPPEGFQTISYPEIDSNLAQIAYSRFQVKISFDGIYADSNEPTTGSMVLDVVANQLTVAREVDIEFEGNVFWTDPGTMKAVRVSNNYFMINPNGVCTTETGEILEIANLRAGQIIGGVENAGPTGDRGEINGYQVWQYGFSAGDLVRPQIQTTADLDLLTGEVWVAPEFQVVIRYVIDMNVENAQLMFGERPVSGRVRLEYNVYDLNLEQNISIPNGC